MRATRISKQFVGIPQRDIETLEDLEVTAACGFVGAAMMFSVTDIIQLLERSAEIKAEIKK